MQYRIYFYNIHMKHMQHTSEMHKTYRCNMCSSTHYRPMEDSWRDAGERSVRRGWRTTRAGARGARRGHAQREARARCVSRGTRRGARAARGGSSARRRGARRDAGLSRPFVRTPWVSLKKKVVSVEFLKLQKYHNFSNTMVFKTIKFVASKYFMSP
jgi:hypothetical protein